MDFYILNQVNNPASYLGCEWGAVNKAPADNGPRWVLAFPDTYAIGMSHLGIKILYHILNANPASAAERVFAPQRDMQRLLSEKGLPLCSLESETPLRDFDVAGFSLLYELCYTNILSMLKLGGIPLHSSDRSDFDPLVIGGGPCASNPEPMAPFFDAFVIGEGEEVVLEINDIVHEARKKRLSRRILMENLSEVGGVYVPSIRASRHARQSGAENGAGMSRPGKTIYARKVIDLDDAPFPTSPVVPLAEATHDRAVVEIARGCPHACRFCHAGYLGRPHRERKPSTVWRLAAEILANTGYEDITLLSLSAGDYRCLPQLAAALAARYAGRGVAVSLPSLRAGSLTAEVIQSIRSMRKTGFTIAPEAGSERLRAVINKNISDDEILHTSKLVFENGWDLIKLYFMFGLPTETDEDMEGIIDLARRVRETGRKAGIKPRINVSLSAFVPKPHTPFQWEGMLREGEIEERLAYFRRRLRIPGVRLKWSKPFMSVLEGLFARGDRSLAGAVERAWEMGAAFDAWGDGIDRSVWQKALVETGIDPEKRAARTIGVDETLPWEHIHIGVDKEWLAAERRRAYSGEVSHGCENAPCGEFCGACDAEVEPVRFDDGTPDIPPPVATRETGDSFDLYRLTYEKTGPARFLGHLDTARVFHRAFRRAGVALQYSQGYHPKPRLSFSDALPVGVASLAESVDAKVRGDITPLDAMERLNRILPPGLSITNARAVPPTSGSIEKTPRRIRCRFGIARDSSSSGNDKRELSPLTEKLEKRLEEYEAATEWLIEKKTKSGVKSLDLKQIIAKINMTGDGVEMEMRVGGSAPRIGIIKAYEALFGPLSPEISVTKTAVIYEAPLHIQQNNKSEREKTAIG